MNLMILALYVGPDQVAPVMSVLATIVGLLMIFWNKVMAVFRKVFGLFKRIDSEPPATRSSDPPKGT